MANNFKKVIDRQIWAQVAPAPNAHAAGMGLCADLRNTVERNPAVYQLSTNAILNRYNIVTKGWSLAAAPSLGGTFGAGAGCVFAPSLGLKGTIAAGATTTTFVPSSPITAIGINMFGNRGGSGEYGFKARITGRAAGSSGKVEERWIVSNTGGTTPTITLDSALSFTPATGDTWEIIAGRVFMLGSGTTAASSWRSFEIATNTIASGASITGLPATLGTDFSAVALDERYTPYDLLPGEGMIVGVSTYNGGILKCLQATASGASSLTGQATDGDASVIQNEYRNFQLRIVEDTAIPTAVGQRVLIASHTAGASPVYTTGTAWAVTPSATAKYVIELPNLIIIRNSTTQTLYTYNYSDVTINNGTTSITSGNWSTTYFTQVPRANAAGSVIIPSWGIRPDSNKNITQAFINFFTGANLDVLNIAGGTNGSWETAAVYDGTVTLAIGSSGAYSPFGNFGKMGYINFYTASVVNQIYRFDVKSRVLTPFTPTDWLQAGTAATGCRITAFCAIDGSDEYDVVLLITHLGTVAQELLVLV